MHDGNFPDPFVLRAGGRYYAYATNDTDGNVQTLVSRDLVRWQQGPDALPELGPWAMTGKTWAPEVLEAADGRYVLYYTASTTEGIQCIGAAVASKPEGPFVDRARKPLVCQVGEGGSIDASPFRDEDGTLYLLWKSDGNAVRRTTYILAQRLSDDGLRLEGEPVRLAQEDAAWEGILVEAPTLWRNDGRYFLFFSANDFGSDAYSVGYATCEAPLGPCEDAEENPILFTKCGAAGPGHQAIVEDADGDTWMIYHAWPADLIGSVVPGRQLWLDPLVWEDGKPVVRGPTCTRQPAP